MEPTVQMPESVCSELLQENYPEIRFLKDIRQLLTKTPLYGILL